MATTKTKYSPSINIVRDSEFELDYIVTPNSTTVFAQILKDIAIGIKSNIIIGAYGVGKSSFLLALQQTLRKQKVHFKGFEKSIRQLPSYDFININGDYSSLIENFAEQFEVPGKKYAAKDVIAAITKKYSSLKRKGKGLAIFIDEFGKFLEYASKHQPESELYFVQQLAELVNTEGKDMLLITTLHQGFNTYSVGLNRSQQQEWNKVSGRLKEIVFNEPVEQLLFLASERISQRFKGTKLDSSFNKLFQCIQHSKAFPLRQHLDLESAKKLYPFDLLSAAVLTLALQRYGQNERSLFSFIESNDYLGINDQLGTALYSVPQVFDYLINAFYSVLSTSKDNQNYAQWSAIREALEKTEGVISPECLADAGAIIKTIGLLNIFTHASGRLDLNFYTSYGKLALGVKNPEKVMRELEKYKLIKYTKHNFRYSLQTGTDLDIDWAIDEAGKVVEKVNNVVQHLNKHFDFPFVAAKSVSYQTGTPRFFQFKLSEDPLIDMPEGEIDGFVNLIFSEDRQIKSTISTFSQTCNEAILFGYYKNTSEIKRLLHEIQKVQTAEQDYKDDKAAVKEFKQIEEHYKRLLSHHVLDSIYSGRNIIWFYRGQEVTINDKGSFNRRLSSICEQVYPATPVFRNELMNKTNISGQISKARNNLLERLLNNSAEGNLGFQTSEFPPEKSIYLSLLKNTGIHRSEDGLWKLDAPQNQTFQQLWNAGESFLDSTKQKERNLQEFIDLFSAKPFKLKQGFIDYWVPIFLLVKSDAFAIYQDDAFIQELSGDIFELMNKKPRLFTIKAFDVTGIKLELFNRYRVLINQTENNNPNSQAFIQTIKPFVTFYKQLPDYAKQTNRLNKQTIALRQIITKAKDPEKTFFEDFPTAFGYNLAELHKKPKLADDFIHRLQDSIRELRTAYDNLINRFEEFFVRDIIGSKEQFPTYRDTIRNRFKSLKKHLLLDHQKPFIARLQSELDDREAWLSSMAQACLNKSLASITDEDELILFDNLRDLLYELDNLCQVSETTVDEEKEEVYKLEITSLVKGLNKGFLRVPREKVPEMEQKQQEIKNLLSEDKKINITILTRLLQELLSDEQ